MYIHNIYAYIMYIHIFCIYIYFKYVSFVHIFHIYIYIHVFHIHVYTYIYDFFKCRNMNKGITMKEKKTRNQEWVSFRKRTPWGLNKKSQISVWYLQKRSLQNQDEKTLWSCNLGFWDQSQHEKTQRLMATPLIRSEQGSYVCLGGLWSNHFSPPFEWTLLKSLC